MLFICAGESLAKVSERGVSAPVVDGLRLSAGRARVQAVTAPILRAVAAAITLGTGASLGPEGPSVDIGKSFAHGLGALLRSRTRRLLPLLAAGSGAGVAS